MRLTTPAPESSTRFSCPTPPWAWCNRPGEGHLTHRSWTGPPTPSERRRGTACGRACSEREGPLMARSQRPADPVIRRVPWQRWGVWDAGPAAIGAVARHTVPRLQHGAAQRAETPPHQVGREVAVPGVQVEAAHATRRPRQVAWLHPAVARGRGGLLGVDRGPRTPEHAAAWVAQVVARGRAVRLLLPEGGNASSAAVLPVVGVVSRRRRRGQVGRKPPPRRVAPTPRCDAQGVTVRHPAGPGVEGSRRVVCGGPRRVVTPWRLRQRGTTLQTAGMARWDGTRRGRVAPRRRRTRCLSWRRARHRGRRWLLVRRSNGVMPPTSLRQGRTPRPPARARGLTDHGWSSRE